MKPFDIEFYHDDSKYEDTTVKDIVLSIIFMLILAVVLTALWQVIPSNFWDIH